MVCPLGRGKMAAIVRILGNGNYPEITAEEAGHEKLAAQTIHWEFYEADEANLLEEEDMHVFDSRPLADPLELVCCNACKKPVKASQYAAHAARCKLIKSAEDLAAELNGGSRLKKPPRKGRKKLQAILNRDCVVGEEGKSESLDGDDDAVSEPNVNEQCAKGGGRVQKRSTVGKSTEMDHHRRNESLWYPLCDPEAPTPLATKTYHLQGSRRLRSTLGQLYFETVNGYPADDPRLRGG